MGTQSLLLFLGILTGCATEVQAAGCDIPQVRTFEENTPAGTVIYTDPKIAKLRVLSINPPFQGLVKAECPSTGSTGGCQLILNASLDFETMSTLYNIKIGCEEKNLPGEITTDMSLRITDVDEFNVTFRNDSVTIKIPENTLVDTTVFEYKKDNPAIDGDKNDNINFKYAIAEGGNGYFEMSNFQSGKVRLVQPLDYDEGQQRFKLNVSVVSRISGIIGSKAFSTLYINVTDVDDQNPEFTKPVYTMTIPEGKYPSTFCLSTNVSAVDGDRGLESPVDIRYRLSKGSRQLFPDLFSITNTGKLCVSGTLEKGSYSLIIEAYQENKPNLRVTTAILNVDVTDINDNPPVMDRSNYNASISEGAPLKSVVLIVSATDNDEGKNGKFAFHLLNNPDEDFKIITSENQGSIISNHLLNRERKSIYQLQVFARETETKEPKTSDLANITIYILDENDNNPFFTNLSYHFYLQQNDSAGTEVGKINALDADEGMNANVTYALENSPDGLFDVNPVTGYIKTVKEFTLHDVGQHRITVIAMDNPSDLSMKRSAFASVIITVRPVNENRPKFDVKSDPVVFQVAEDEMPDYLIGQVSASDADGDTITYAIRSGNSEQYIRIGPNDGKLYLNKIHDLDTSPTLPNISLLVEASDGTYEATIDVEIHFVYVNEFPPKFNPVSIIKVFENSTKGSYITTVTATDKDKGPGGQISYYLLQSQASSFFSIDSESGEITLNCTSCLDYNNNKVYDLIVKAEDHGNPPKTSLINLGIQIVKSEFAQPRFPASKFTFFIEENKPASFIGQVYANDADTPATDLHYTLTPLDQPVDDWLTVESDGKICSSKPLDAEKFTELIFNISVSDGHSSDTTTVVVEVGDVNDEAPVILLPKSSINVPENVSLGYVSRVMAGLYRAASEIVANVSAEDKDVSSTVFTFWLGDGSDGKFSINATTGLIVVSGVFDRTEKQDYSIPIYVSDNGGQPQIVSTLLTVHITNSNSAPEFDLRNYNMSLYENVSVGYVFGFVHASDPDGASRASGRLVYEIESGNEGNTFSLNANNGSLTLSKELNYEQRVKYTLVVLAIDEGVNPRQGTATVTIIVVDVPEAPQWPPHISQVFLTQSSACDDDGVTIVTKLRAFGDDESVQYRLLNMTEEFSLNASTGLLLTKKIIGVGTYALGIDACNLEGTACSPLHLIVVIQSDDILVFCPAFYHVNVNESESSRELLNVTVNEPKEDVTFAIESGNDDGKFELGPKTGILKLVSSLDREVSTSYVLYISGKSLKTTHTATAQILIDVIDDNDSPPRFSSNKYEGEISEGEKIGAFVLKRGSRERLSIFVSDPDENQQITLAIDSTNDNSHGIFMIDENGTIHLQKLIDVEKIPPALQKMYTFKILAKDGVNIASTTVEVKVIDENDNAPEFDSSSYNISVSEGQLPPWNVIEITAKDKDGLDAHRLLYSFQLLHPVHSNPFTINSLTGMITLQQPLDREKDSFYIFQVNATDTSGQVASTELTINITDVNDNGPVFDPRTYTFEVQEDTASARMVLYVTDNDEGEYARLSYSITSPKGFSKFRLEPGMNEVTLVQTEGLHWETNERNGTAFVILQVTAYDNGNPPLNGSCIVRINITDTNDNRPEFMPRSYNASLSENTQNGTFVVKVNVEDRDGPQYGKPSIVFAISEESEDLPFRIDEKTGEVFVSLKNEALDYDSKQEYDLNITATDDYGNGLLTWAIVRIFLENLNDEAPTFVHQNYSFRVARNAAPGAVVGTVNATDPDRDGTITYYTTSTTPFSVDPFNGTLSVAGQLSSLTQSSYTLTVIATDSVHDARTTVTVIVISCPSWDPSSLWVHMKENASVGDLVGQIRVINVDVSSTTVIRFSVNDTGKSGYTPASRLDGKRIVTYSTDLLAQQANPLVCASGKDDENNIFNISETGDVYLKKTFDPDVTNKDRFTVGVFATDNGNPPCFISGKLRVVISTINDNDPEICFSDECGVKEIQVSVLDRAGIGAVMALFKSRDNDTGADGRTAFHLQGPPSVVDYFNVTNDGVLTLARALNLTNIRASNNFSYGSSIVLTLVIVDGGKPPRSASATVNVTIVPTTSSIPLFMSNLYTMSVPENQPKDTSIGKVMAVADSGAPARYSLLQESATFLPFKINPNSGEIETTGSLNRETHDSYQFVVIARHQSDKYFSQSLVKVEVTDENDNDPVFDDADLTWHIQENIIPKEPLRVHASDSDEGENATVSYEMVNGTTYFKINETTGDIYLKQELDRESLTELYFVIKAIDGGMPPNTATANIHVVVEDDNDETPQFQPSPEYDITFETGVPPDKLIIQVNATDEDLGNNGRVLYSLVGSQPYFSIERFSGRIWSRKRLEAGRYSFQVQARDLGRSPQSSKANVTVVVEEKNIPVTKIDFELSNKTINLFVGMEQGLNLSSLGLTITSENVLAIEITDGNEDGLFTLRDGSIVLEKTLTSDALYRLELKTGNDSQNEVIKELEVRVLPLQFYQALYDVIVTENLEAPRSLLNLSSPPEAYGIPVIYSLNQTYSHFRMQPYPGELILTDSLDREKTPFYDLTILMELNMEKLIKNNRRKRETNSGSKVATAKVIVKVQDANDNLPTFGVNVSKLSFTIPRNAPSGYLITTLKAFDADEGVNGEIVYTIAEGNTSAVVLGQKSGELLIGNVEALSRLKSLVVRVKASNGIGKQGAELTVEIDIQDESHEVHLIAPITLSTFKDNKDTILGKLRTILGYNLTVLSATLYERNSIVDTESTDIMFQAYGSDNSSFISSATLERIINEKQAEVTSLFDSYKEKPIITRTKSKENDDTVAIILITIAGIMFVASLVANLVVVRLWKRQKDYQKREQNAQKARQNNSFTEIESVAMSSDPDEPLELDIDLDDSSVFGSKFTTKHNKEFPTVMGLISTDGRDERRRPNGIQNLAREDDHSDDKQSSSSQGGGEESHDRDSPIQGGQQIHDTYQNIDLNSINPKTPSPNGSAIQMVNDTFLVNVRPAFEENNNSVESVRQHVYANLANLSNKFKHDTSAVNDGSLTLTSLSDDEHGDESQDSVAVNDNVGMGDNEEVTWL